VKSPLHRSWASPQHIDQMAPKKKTSSTALEVDPENSLGQSTDEADAEVIEELKKLYKDKLLPIERTCQFHKFNQPEILDSELAAKPTVLLVGQYSTGKTTFIRNLIGMDYPEMHIGPEPTTDRFIAVVHGHEAKIIKGNALTGVSELPFSGLSTFGSSFLNKFNAAVVPAPLLKNINIIDTPGVLSGEKQRTSRGYDFAKVSRWFAERSDLILLLFDCSKLDISDEFKSVIEELQPHEDKVHCVLNKADQLDQESLMRVYGALLWSMGRIFRGAEVARIYVGSFHDEPLMREEHKTLFDKDRKVLMDQLEVLPKACSMRKVNEMVKRLRKAVVHVCIMGHLRSKMPMLWGKEKTQMRLIEQLDSVFAEVRRTYQLAEGDFPKIDEYRAALALSDMSTFPRIDRHVLNTLQDMLLKDVPKITALIAGVGSSASSGKFSRSGKNLDRDEGGESDRLPQMFKFSEGSEGGDKRGQAALALVVAVAIALVAAFVASVMDDHRVLLFFSAELKRAIHDFQDKLTKH
jgi:EH domain-containing protein 1